MSVPSQLQAHLDTGVTTLCRAWKVERADGVVLGFTDHDRPLNFDGVTFKADSGLTANALQKTTGLAVDNCEAVGALSAAAIIEADLAAGRYDGAKVTLWLVNWADVDARHVLFSGTIGEVQCGAGGFQAELRGLSEALNAASGRVFQRLCTADLGDKACGIDLRDPAYTTEATVAAQEDSVTYRLQPDAGMDSGWFERGRLTVLSGAATGISAFVKSDTLDGGDRLLALWQELRAELAPGDRVRLQAGCDKRLETCRTKFDNRLNFRGFPHIPGEDWLTAYPKQSGRNDGGRRST